MSGAPAVDAGRAGLAQRVTLLLDDAAETYAGHPEAERLQAAAVRLQAPLRVAIAGRIKAGKSTLLNALVGEQLAATDAGECTRVVTEYANGVASRAWAYPVHGEPVQVPYRRVAGATVLELGDYSPEELRRLRVEVPNANLERLTLIDTPGIASLSADVSARTTEFFAADGSAAHAGGVDAVLYLLRHLHASDVNFLESFSDAEFRGTSPVHALGVLSRADEIGSGQGDGLQLAGEIAFRYRRDPRVRGLVSTVVPVAGLLAQSAAGLRERQFAAFGALAALPMQDLLAMLLSADRFVDSDRDEPVPADERRALLAGFGLYGVRLAVALVQQRQVTSAAELARELLRRSGLPELRDLLRSSFVERRDLLKAQVALRELTAVLASRPIPAAGVLRRRQEEVLASAHELAELRLLGELRLSAEDVPGEDAAGQPAGFDLDDDQREQVERLLGAAGASAPARLGMAADSSSEDVRAAVLDALRIWAGRAESPALPMRQRRAAEVVRRTCEGLLADLPATPAGRPRVRTFG